MAATYWRSNSMADEGERPRLLEELADGRTRALLERAGIDRGWRCAEVGAGAGSVARWLGDRVGPTGSVLAIDVDTTLLQPLGAGDTITVVERPKQEDSVEVHIAGEFVGVLFKDEEDGEISYAFNMAILEMDLPEPPAGRT